MIKRAAAGEKVKIEWSIILYTIIHMYVYNV